MWARRLTRVEQTRSERAKQIVSDSTLGVSFSLLVCDDYGFDWRSALHSTLRLGFRRFRLMSYWTYGEKQQGVYDFRFLDEQIAIIAAAGGRVTLSIGMRQPRWPEHHIPDWAKGLDRQGVVRQYMRYHRVVIERYKNHDIIESWQLENEFWLTSFGDQFDTSRKRLVDEFKMIRQYDPERPIIMSTARLLSLPLFAPKPDIYATSIYRITYDHKKGYRRTVNLPLFYRIKKTLLSVFRFRSFIVHELQAEPWGPVGNAQLGADEQLVSMNSEEIVKAVEFARKTGMTYFDLWGAEWWYWRSVHHNDNSINVAVAELVAQAREVSRVKS